MGIPEFGSVCAVFATEAVRNLTVVASVDTGIIEMACNDSFSKTHWHHGNCSEGVKMLGSLDHFDHLLLQNHFFWGGNLQITIARLFGETAEVRATAVEKNDTLMYLEPDVAGVALYPSSIKMLIGSFSDLFGTEKGALLQSWCIKMGWALSWALGFAGGDERTDPTRHVGINRVLDPLVQQQHQRLNISAAVVQNGSATFRRYWQALNSSKGLRPAPNASDAWSQNWGALLADMPMRRLDLRSPYTSAPLH